MSKFIEIDNSIINIEDIRRVITYGNEKVYSKFIEDQECNVVNFTYAKIVTFDNAVIELMTNISRPEKNESMVDHMLQYDMHTSNILQKLYEALKPISITGEE